MGRGILFWWRVERQTGRYGSVWLSDSFDAPEDCPSPMVVCDLGSCGQLIAWLLDEGGIPLPDYYATPRRPGQLVPLGEGRSFVADLGGPPLALGVKPATGRKYNWLSANCLHFLQACRVELLWAPRAKPRTMRTRFPQRR